MPWNGPVAWLKACLGIAAMAAARKRNCYSNTQYRRIAARCGAKRTRVAVAHSLLTAAWHVLSTNTAYHDLGADYFLQREDPQRRIRKMISILEGHGYTVTTGAA